MDLLSYEDDDTLSTEGNSRYNSPTYREQRIEM